VTQEFSFSDARAFLATALDDLAPHPAESRIANSVTAVVRTEPLVTDLGERLPAVSKGEGTRTPPPDLYVPILMPAKGDLIDRLEIFRSDGSAAHAVSHTQTLRLLSLGLRFLLLAALADPGTEAPVFDDKEFRKAELSLLRLVARRGPLQRSGDTRESLVKEVEATLESLEREFPRRQASDSERVQAFDEVRDYVLRLAYSYPIVVSLPSSEQPYRRLAYERIIPPKPLETPRLRLWLGLRPDTVEVPITLAFEADSYHLEVVGPAEYYLRDQFLGCPQCHTRMNSAWRGLRSRSDNCRHAPIGIDERCYVRVERRAGQNYTHAYMRGLAASHLDEHGQELTMNARFAEAPPGVEERALLAALAASVAIGVIGYLRTKSSAPPPLTDIPAFLLAIPGVAATWFSVSSDAETVFRSSLTARISLLATGLLSLVAISCYLLQIPLGWRRGPHWGFLGVHEWVWLALLAAALFNTVVISYKAAARMLHFVWLSSRPITRLDKRVRSRQSKKEATSS
jgi:hypothetical protein